jgi:hypothetical protein
VNAPTVEAKILRNTISTAAGIELPPQPTLMAYARLLDVVVCWPRVPRGLGRLKQT